MHVVSVRTWARRARVSHDLNQAATHHWSGLPTRTHLVSTRNLAMGGPIIMAARTVHTIMRLSCAQSNRHHAKHRNSWPEKQLGERSHNPVEPSVNIENRLPSQRRDGYSSRSTRRCPSPLRLPPCRLWRASCARSQERGDGTPRPFFEPKRSSVTSVRARSVLRGLHRARKAATAACTVITTQGVATETNQCLRPGRPGIAPKPRD